MEERITEKQAGMSRSDHWAYSHQTHASAQSVDQIERDFLHAFRFYRALLKHHLPPSLDASILDLPCGEGRIVYFLQKLGYRNVLGYDLDAFRLATGQKLDLPIYSGNVFTELEQRSSKSVDCILAMDFLEHLEKDQVIHFLQLASDRLSSGGRILVRTPCADAFHGAAHVFNDFTHKWGATSGVLAQLLTASGFESVKVIGEHPTWDMTLGYLRAPIFKISSGIVNLLVRGLQCVPYRIWSASMWGIGIKPPLDDK